MVVLLLGQTNEAQGETTKYKATATSYAMPN